MAIDTLAPTASMATLRTFVNTMSTNIGDMTLLNSAITSQTNPDDLVQAINYVYTVATASETTFANGVTFQSTIDVQGAATFENNVTVEGSLTFNDTGSAAVTIILDEDNMLSDSNTALATQQSIKAYVDALTGTVDAGTLDGVDSASFLRSDADDTVNNNIHIQFGDGTAGSVRLEHGSTNNDFQLLPHDGTSFNTAMQFGFDADNDYWLFAGEMQVAGAFTSVGIDDNATSEQLQVADALVTIRTATEVQGNLTITTGDIIVPDADSVDITNSAGEFVRIDGSTGNAVELYAGNLIGAGVTATAASLYYAGAAKIATTNTGVSVTGDVAFSDDLIGPASFTITNSGNDYIDITASTIDFYVNATKRLNVDTAGVDVTGALTVSSTLSAGATTLTGNLTGGNTFTIDNGSTEKLRFTTTQVFLEVGDANILEANATGVDITGNLDVSGTITGTLGDISTGTINSGAITSTGLIQSNTGLTLTGGDIILPSGTTAADVGNNAGEYVRFDGTNNETEIRAAANIGMLVKSTTTDMRYSGSAKLTTASGGISVTGTITATGDITGNTSDERLKEVVNYNLLDNPLDTLKEINPVAFKWKDIKKTIDPAADLENVKVGFLAQNIEDAFPVALGSDVDGIEKYKTVRYEAIIPLLVKAVQELDKKIDGNIR